MEEISAEQSDIVIKEVRDDDRDDDNHADVFSYENKSQGKGISGTDSFNGVQAHKDEGTRLHVQNYHDVQPRQVQTYQHSQHIPNAQLHQGVQPQQVSQYAHLQGVTTLPHQLWWIGSTRTD